MLPKFLHGIKITNKPVLFHKIIPQRGLGNGMFGLLTDSDVQASQRLKPKLHVVSWRLPAEPTGQYQASLVLESTHPEYEEKNGKETSKSEEIVQASVSATLKIEDLKTMQRTEWRLEGSGGELTETRFKPHGLVNLIHEFFGYPRDTGKVVSHTKLGAEDSQRFKKFLKRFGNRDYFPEFENAAGGRVPVGWNEDKQMALERGRECARRQLVHWLSQF